MLQRRERFLQEIRRKEREQIKNKLRTKYLQELQEQRDSPTTPPCLELSNIYSILDKPYQQQQSVENNQGSKFLQALNGILEQFIGRPRASKQQISPLQFLVTFSQHLNQHTDKHQVSSALEFFELGLKFKDEYFGSISYFKRQILEAQIIIAWNSVFNMLFLIIYHIKCIKILDELTPELQKRFNFYFQEWIQRTCITIQLQFQENIQYNIFCHQMIIQNLKEISAYIDLCVGSSFHAPLHQMLNERMIDGLQRSLFSYRMDQVGNIFITNIFLKIVKSPLRDVYKRIIQGDFLNTIRYVIQFQLNINLSITNHQLKQQKAIFHNILQFIVEGCYLCSSDIYWSQGICSQLRMKLNQGINDKALYQNIVTVIFVCITTIQEKESISLMNQSDILDWVLKILGKCIENRSYYHNIDQLIRDAIDIIEFFFNIEATNNLQRNPYFLKLLYGKGIELLETFPQGIDFLQRIGYLQQRINSIV